MTSTAYKLVSNYGLKPLGPHGWLHSLKTGQIVIPNPNEKGEKGSILDLFLAADRQRWPRIIGKVENEGFLPDPLHEELVIWLMEKGANPWIRHEGRNAWTEALYRGWPSVMRYLCARPDAPSKRILEQEIIYRDHCWDSERRKSTVGMLAPAAFAERDQIDALKAWAELGFSVNLGMEQELNAGTRARTPEFLSTWADLGGAITEKTPRGTPLKCAWSFSNVAHQVAMERVWAKYQLPDSRPVDERIDEALDLILKDSPRTLVAHRLRELNLTPLSSEKGGEKMRDRWVEKHLQDPGSTAPAVALMMLEHAPDELVWKVVVKGLREAGNHTSKFFPTPRQLEALLSSERFGPVSEVLYKLANKVSDCPKAMNRIFGHSRDHIRNLTSDCAKQLDRKTVKAIDVLKVYWGEWFFHPDDPPGQHRGWQAFAAWLSSDDEVSTTFSLYQAILSATGDYSSKAAEGIDLLIAAQARDDLKRVRFPSALLKQWEEGGKEGWVEGYNLQSQGSTSPTLADEVWEYLIKKHKSFVGREVLSSFMAKLSEKRMETQIPGPVDGLARTSRLRF